MLSIIEKHVDRLCTDLGFLSQILWTSFIHEPWLTRYMANLPLLIRHGTWPVTYFSPDNHLRVTLYRSNYKTILWKTFFPQADAQPGHLGSGGVVQTQPAATGPALHFLNWCFVSNRTGYRHFLSASQALWQSNKKSMARWDVPAWTLTGSHGRLETVSKHLSLC